MQTNLFDQHYIVDKIKMTLKAENSAAAVKTSKQYVILMTGL